MNDKKGSMFQTCMWALGGLMVFSSSVFAHHGTGISYNCEKPWTTPATVTEFRYANPHAQLFWDRTNERGVLEHWVSELNNNPSQMFRAGWSKVKSVAAVPPGTKVTLTLCTSRAGGQSALVRRIQDAEGQDILTGGGLGPQHAISAQGAAGRE